MEPPFTYDQNIIIPTCNIEQIPEDVYYITAPRTNIIIVVTYDPTEFLHVLIDLCINSRLGVRSYILKNSMHKRCTCRMCGIVNTNYIINHTYNGITYMLQICINCVDKLLPQISLSNNNSQIALLNCINVYNSLPNHDINNVKYITTYKVDQIYISNRQRKTTKLCKLCKYISTTSDACDRCVDAINTNFILISCAKYTLLCDIVLPELANIIGIMYILVSYQLVN